jgi:exonuclease III
VNKGSVAQNSTPNLSAVLLNAQSLKNKFDDFHNEIIQQHSPSVVFVTETWLSPDYPDCLVDQDSAYNIFRKDRNSNSGGVLIMIRKDLSSAALEHRSFDCLELVTVRTRVLNRDVIFACFYRSSVNDVHLLKPLTDALDYLLKFNVLLCFCGDFNLPGIKWNVTPPRSAHSYKQDKFLDLFRSRGLYQHVTENTRGSNTLDLVFSNEKHALNDIKNLTTCKCHC